MSQPFPSGALRELQSRLPRDAIIEDRDVLASYRRDEARTVPAGSPAIALFPQTTDEVRASIEVAATYGFPVVPRGAGSGLSGGANAVDGCIVLCLERMDRIVELDPTEAVAVVEPGVLTGNLKAAAAAHGLHYAPDPASSDFCTVGGNIATNAGGLCCVRYGVTRDHVLGLEVVLADGSAVRTGRRTLKGVAGYDLTSLFVGSEGTLGIVTSATLRLVASPPAQITVVAFFASVAAACTAAVGLLRSGPTTPSMLELMDRTTIAAVDDWRRMGLDRDAEALVLAQADIGAPSMTGTGAGWLAERLEASGATYVAETSDRDEAQQLLWARRLAYPALERLGAALLDDVVVPLGGIPKFVADVQDVAAASGLTVGTFGHVGDGNLHPTIVFDAADAAQRSLANEVFCEIVRLALDAGGTITGEHGVGSLKQDFLAQEIGPVGARIHDAIKAALDPDGILNPGKVVASRTALATTAEGRS